jgi:hypothetical protein
MDVDMALSDAFLRAPDVKGLASRDSPPPYWKNVSPHALRNGWPGLILRILRALCIVTAAWLLLWAGSEYIRKARVRMRPWNAVCGWVLNRAVSGPF